MYLQKASKETGFCKTWGVKPRWLMPGGLQVITNGNGSG